VTSGGVIRSWKANYRPTDVEFSFKVTRGFRFIVWPDNKQGVQGVGAVRTFQTSQCPGKHSSCIRLRIIGLDIAPARSEIYSLIAIFTTLLLAMI
jgi:hypothetical protein